MPPAAPSAAMAASNLRLWPAGTTPRSFVSSAVNLRRTSGSTALSRIACSYCASSRFASQAAISTCVPCSILPTSARSTVQFKLVQRHIVFACQVPSHHEGGMVNQATLEKASRP